MAALDARHRLCSARRDDGILKLVTWFPGGTCDHLRCGLRFLPKDYSPEIRTVSEGLAHRFHIISFE